jgi:hypothetical protein
MQAAYRFAIAWACGNSWFMCVQLRFCGSMCVSADVSEPDHPRKCRNELLASQNDVSSVRAISLPRDPGTRSSPRYRGLHQFLG